MALKTCIRCKQDLSTANFIATNSPFFVSSAPICKKCLNQIIKDNTDKEGNNWDIVDKICQWMDIPFVPEEWGKVFLTAGDDALSSYCAIFRDAPYNQYSWSDYNKVYLQLQEENRMIDAMPEIKQDQLLKLKKKWGPDYDEEDLVYLENLHKGLLESYNINGALNEDQALKLCKISFIIEGKIRAGADFSKELKSYDDLAKSANLTPKNIKEANEFDSFGEVYAYLEKTGWENLYYDGAVRDEVDQTEKNMKNWLRALYVGETGIAEDIEERIKELKNVDKAINRQTDDKELLNFLQSQEFKSNEEFKLFVE